MRVFGAMENKMERVDMSYQMELKKWVSGKTVNETNGLRVKKTLSSNPKIGMNLVFYYYQ